MSKNLFYIYLLLSGAILSGCVNTTKYTSTMYGNNPYTVTEGKGKHEKVVPSGGSPLY